MANTPRQILALGLERLEGHIKTIGLYIPQQRRGTRCRPAPSWWSATVAKCRARAANWRPPARPVGRKTANVVLNVVPCGEPTMAVQTFPA